VRRDIDSSLQTNDSKRLDSSCDSILTRPSHDSDTDSTRKIFRLLWLQGFVTLTRPWLDKNDSDTSLAFRNLILRLEMIQQHRLTTKVLGSFYHIFVWNSYQQNHCVKC